MNQDFRDLLSIFNAHGVKYLVVGAHALAAYGHVRATKDMDIWVHASPENARLIMAALREFGAPLRDLNETDLGTPGTVFQIGIAPVRIDILTELTGLRFEESWEHRQTIKFAGEPTPVLSADDLIRNKIAIGRPQDKADVAWLRKHVKRQPPSRGER